MQLQIDVNNIKLDIFLELLNLFKKDNMINDYKILNNKADSYDDNIINDLQAFDSTLKDAKNGLGHVTTKTINIQKL